MADTLLTASARTLGVARLLAAELETSEGPATVILEDRLRKRLGDHYRLRLHVTGPDPHPGTRLLTDEEQYRLGAPGGRCCWRTGLLLYDLAEIAAAVTLLWLPARLTVDACVALAHAAAPAGKALPGMQREDRRALALTGHERERDSPDALDIAVTSSAVLVVDTWPAAIATERITRSFAELLAD